MEEKTLMDELAKGIITKFEFGQRWVEQRHSFPGP
jgi:hypothetical protein